MTALSALELMLTLGRKFNINITDSIKDITKDLWGNKTRYYASVGQDPYWQ